MVSSTWYCDSCKLDVKIGFSGESNWTTHTESAAHHQNEASKGTVWGNEIIKVLIMFATHFWKKFLLAWWDNEVVLHHYPGWVHQSLLVFFFLFTLWFLPNVITWMVSEIPLLLWPVSTMTPDICNSSSNPNKDAITKESLWYRWASNHGLWCHLLTLELNFQQLLPSNNFQWHTLFSRSPSGS